MHLWLPGTTRQPDEYRSHRLLGMLTARRCTVTKLVARRSTGVLNCGGLVTSIRDDKSKIHERTSLARSVSRCSPYVTETQPSAPDCIRREHTDATAAEKLGAGVKLWGIPPDLRSGTSYLRSPTSVDRSCTSQLRSDT